MSKRKIESKAKSYRIPIGIAEAFEAFCAENEYKETELVVDFMRKLTNYKNLNPDVEQAIEELKQQKNVKYL